MTGDARLLELVVAATEKADTDAVTPEQRKTALIMAAEGGHARCVEILVGDGGANVDWQDAAGRTALHYAIFSESSSSADYGHFSLPSKPIHIEKKT